MRKSVFVALLLTLTLQAFYYAQDVEPTLERIATQKQSVAIALQLKEPVLKANVLAFVARNLANQGEEDVARVLFKEALRLVSGLKNENSRTWMQAQIAEALAQAGQFEWAVEIALTVKQSEFGQKAIRQITEKMASVGDFEKALQIAELINLQNEREGALVAVAEKMTQVGLHDRALAIVRKVADTNKRSQIICRVAESLAQVGRFEEAVKVAAEIQFSAWRSVAVYAITRRMAEREIYDKAWQVAVTFSDPSTIRAVLTSMVGRGYSDQAIALARSIDDANLRLTALHSVAVALAQQGQKEAAKALLSECQDLATRSQDGKERVIRLAELSVAMSAIGEHHRAKILIQEAIKIAETIADVDQKAQLMSQIAEMLAKVGQLEDALLLAQSIEHWGKRRSAQEQIVVILAEQGQFEQALKVAKEAGLWLPKLLYEAAKTGRGEWALREAAEIKNLQERQEAFANIALGAMVAQDWELAFEAAKRSQNDDVFLRIFRAWLLSLVRKGQTYQALQEVERITDGNEREKTLADIALVLSQKGE